MLSPSKKRMVFGGVILVVIILLAVPYVNVSRYRDSVANSLGQAVGHRVTIREISLQGLPQPGLLLKGVVVDDDPTISAEPMLRDDDEVLATLRLTSLWRGRLEISSLKLKYPSLNLVQGQDGRWNIASLLERARQTPAAPTTNKRPETRLRFPYIEATGARINLKIGQEKKVFALGDADFALWLASESEWRMRLSARPIRTDANLTDTGNLKAEGSWKRAGQLRDTPLTFRLWLENGQLGQLTTLVYGHDRGWRGTVRASAIVEGLPENLKVITTAKVEDFRRYDIASGDAITLQAKCDAIYAYRQRQLQNVYCESPAGNGKVTLSGNLGFLQGKNTADLNFAIQEMPVQFVAALSHHVRSNVPQDIEAAGTLNAQFSRTSDNKGTSHWAGYAESSPILLKSSALSAPLRVESTHWKLFRPGAETTFPSARQSRSIRARQNISEPRIERITLLSEPISLDTGGLTPTTITAFLDPDGFRAEAAGDVELGRIVEVGRLLGLPTIGAEIAGTAKGHLSVAGDWTGVSPTFYTGEAQLQRVTAKLSGVASPVRIASARFTADDRALSLTKVTAEIENLHSKFDFAATWPRCPAVSGEPAGISCELHFDVRADQLNLDEINSLLNPKAQKRPWYAALTGGFSEAKRTLPAIRASGKVSAAKLIMKQVTATHAVAELSISPSGFTISGLNTDLLGGSYVGDLTADYTGDTPSYRLAGNVVDMSLESLANLMHDGWASGKLTGAFKASTRGWNAQQIVANIDGTGTFDWRDGVLHHLDLESHGKPLQFRDFRGKLDFKNGVLSISQSKLQAARSIYLVSGTASLGRELELKFARDGEPSYSITGSLARPKVIQEQIPRTQASLKQKTK